jgi:hypothetical protein
MALLSEQFGTQVDSDICLVNALPLDSDICLVNALPLDSDIVSYRRTYYRHTHIFIHPICINLFSEGNGHTLDAMRKESRLMKLAKPARVFES